MIDPGDCRFIGSIISIRGAGSARVRRVDGDKIVAMTLDGHCKECYYNDIQYVWKP